MPIRRVMTNHDLPAWYAWVIVLVTMVLLSGGAMALAIRSARQAIEVERQSRIDSNEATRVATCAVISAQREAFREVPPATNAGKKAAESWERLSRQLRCE